VTDYRTVDPDIAPPEEGDACAILTMHDWWLEGGLVDPSQLLTSWVTEWAWRNETAWDLIEPIPDRVEFVAQCEALLQRRAG
jgi:hypothetical protein